MKVLDLPSTNSLTGLDPKVPTIWLAEGLVQYLPEAQSRKLLKTIHDFSVPESTLAFDITSSHKFPDVLGKSPLYEELARQGNPLVFSLQDPAPFVQACGWKNVIMNEKGDTFVQYSKLRSYPLPKWVTFIPRTWLIRAFK